MSSPETTDRPEQGLQTVPGVSSHFFQVSPRWEQGRSPIPWLMTSVQGLSLLTRGGERQALSRGSAISIIITQSMTLSSPAQNPFFIAPYHPKRVIWEGLPKPEPSQHLGATGQEPQSQAVRSITNKWPKPAAKWGQAGSNQERMKLQQLA